MHETSGFVTIAVVAILGAMSPGPNIVVVTKNSLTYSRKTGIYTAFGVSLGVFVHIAYCLISLSFFIAQSALLFNTIKYVGAAYLIYLGVKSLLIKRSISANGIEIVPENDLNALKALKMGFFTNVLNPQATLFFISIFSQLIDPNTSLIIQIAYAFEIWLIALIWYCLLAFVLSHSMLKCRLANIQYYIEKAMGMVLLVLGLKVAIA